MAHYFINFFKHYVYFPLGGNRRYIQTIFKHFFCYDTCGFLAWRLRGILLFGEDSTEYSYSLIIRGEFLLEIGLRVKKLNIIKVLLTFLCVTVAWAFLELKLLMVH